MSDAAVQRPSPSKRGRGRGRGGGGRGAASARARGKPAAGRRGRAKVYDTTRAQAAHERQRDLRNAYSSLASAMKPALEELADRNLDRLKSDFNAHQEVDQYNQITTFLKERHRDRVDEVETKYNYSIACQNHQINAQKEYTLYSYRNRFSEKVEEYYDTLLRRLDILQQLSQNGEPVDKPDESWNYKSITTEEAAQQGIYCKIHKGVEVPYPRLHPELCREEEAGKSKTLRTPSKRKAANQLEDANHPKRPVSALDGQAAAAIPRHIGGLLSAVAPDEPVSQPPSPSPVDDNGDAASPQANEPTAAARGRKRKRLLEASPVPMAASMAMGDGAEESEAEEDEAMPPLPNGAGEPDEYGVRLINKRARINDMPNNRIMTPPLYEYESHEIGFRDSTNDKSRGATKAKRRKFLNQPNAGAMFFDRNNSSYDATRYADGDLDQDTIAKHNIHPKYGLFMEGSVNDSEPARPYQSGWMPTVFVSDDGKVQHTSRSIRAAKAEEAYVKLTMQNMMRRHMEQEDISEDDLMDRETRQLMKERDEKRRELERQEDEAQDVHDQQVAAHNVALLLDAAAASEAQELQKTKTQSVSPALSRPSTMSRPYDAIRDVFAGSDLPPAAASTINAPRFEDATKLMALADLAALEPRTEALPMQIPADAAAQEPRQRIPIQMPEPVRPKQLRDPSDLEQREQQHVVDYPDPDNEFVPRQIAFSTNFVGRQPGYPMQPPPHAYQERAVSQSPLARPESYAYRGELSGRYEQQQQQQQQQQPPRQPMQPPQGYLGQHDAQSSGAPHDSYAYGEPETSYEQQQQPLLRRPSQLSQRSEEQFAPVRPNTTDVALLDPMLFEGGQRPGTSQLQAPQPEQQQPPKSQATHSGGVLQQPQNSFFQTALNAPGTPTSQDLPQVSEYGEPSSASQAHFPPGPPPLASSAAPHQFPGGHEGSPGRTPFSNPIGTENMPVPTLRPLHRGSGPLVAPTASGAQVPQHVMMTPGEPADPYAAAPPLPPGSAYLDQAYALDGFGGPDQPIMSTEQGPRHGYMAQPMMHPSQQQQQQQQAGQGGAYPPPHQSYPPPGSTGPQHPSHNDYSPSGPSGQPFQSPPPYGSSGPGVSPSPSRRSNSISSSSRNNKQYREIKPAPRQAETWEPPSAELRTFMFNPYEGIRDYPATAPPPTHGPTMIRGWTHTTGTRKSRGKNSTDSHIDPSLGREEKNDSEDTPAEDEDTPMPDAPEEHAPVEDTPVEDMPAEDKPVEDTPLEDTPLQDTPQQDTSPWDTRREDSPMEELQFEDIYQEDRYPEDALTEEDYSDEEPTLETLEGPAQGRRNMLDILSGFGEAPRAISPEPTAGTSTGTNARQTSPMTSVSSDEEEKKREEEELSPIP
ncbi:hypothetical protein M406DRAFT_325141 [Cryphonectria parasitica EP155]|uniref:Uncharacterized protein n=1 Tax=Cryphonectria parasitica (strain ATCC 38755 / EP155) TaxID=660469 RepID=A0A9P4YBJ5_CRYP1|nr:uncharacterized protein M406DRAFT_325141 [Cryphonectria parasitica EP155]KAF3769650.1 hypothetical protein M406DRAFT_325141 [Cryphonectria parasitica EP155]